jgi:AraC-like DNA-binding protein
MMEETQMKIESYTPTRFLRSFVKEYKFIESQTGMESRILPNTSFTLVFCLRGGLSYTNDSIRHHLPSAAFSGLRKSARLIKYEPGTSSIIVLFQETGFAGLLKNPLHEFFEEIVPLNAFFPRDSISTLQDQLELAIDNETRIHIIENFLISNCSFSPDNLVIEAISLIHANRGMVKMSDLADDLSISKDAFEKRFRKVVGTTPKHFSSIVRMNTVIRQNAVSPSLLDLAFMHGYYDQAHFIKDFKRFTGQTPTGFFKSNHRW